MKKLYTIIFLIFISASAFSKPLFASAGSDTDKVKSLNQSAYDNRFSNSNTTISYAVKALALATPIKYYDGMAEAHRVKGIGEYYQNKSDSAINDYLEAQKYFEMAHDELGAAKVYNNIGNLYQSVDYGKALEYFGKAEVIAKKNNNLQLIASLNLNIGDVFFRKNSFSQAEHYYTSAYEQFKTLKSDKNKVFLVQCLQNLGAIYFHRDSIDKAEKLLLEANQDAKEKDMNSSVASMNLEIAELYIKKKNFVAAEKFVKEGIAFSELINNEKFINEYKYMNYELEEKRQNYKAAVTYLFDLYKRDSVLYNTDISTKFNLFAKEQEHLTTIELAAKAKENANQRFWLLAVAAGLLLVLIGLLANNVKRKATTNAQLTELNNEISRQKDNLDRINHHLEEIIDERTRDLQVKNKKLSEYSSYLSHQIRGPIATLKGLMNLEKEGLVDQQECIKMMDKCVSEIDEKIIEMSDMLHEPAAKA